MIKTPTLLIKLEGRARLNPWGQTDFQLPPNELERALSAGRSGEAGGFCSERSEGKQGKKSPRKEETVAMNARNLPPLSTNRQTLLHRRGASKKENEWFSHGSPRMQALWWDSNPGRTLGAPEEHCHAPAAAQGEQRSSGVTGQRSAAIPFLTALTGSHQPALSYVYSLPFVPCTYLKTDSTTSLLDTDKPVLKLSVPHSLTFLLHSVHGFEWKEAINLPGHQWPRSLSKVTSPYILWRLKCEKDSG